MGKLYFSSKDITDEINMSGIDVRSPEYSGKKRISDRHILLERTMLYAESRFNHSTFHKSKTSITYKNQIKLSEPQ